MLRDDTQAAVSSLHAALWASAHHYRRTARQLAAHRTLLIAKAEHREALARELATQVRNLGTLPDVPDPERDAAGVLGKTLRAQWHGGSAEDFVEILALEDAALAARVKVVETMPALPAATRELLTRIVHALEV